MFHRVSLASVALATVLVMPAIGQDAFPVTIQHAYGETTIAQKPQRIVTLIWMSQEAMLALGEQPVAIQAQAWGGDEQGYLPWIVEAYQELGQPLPPVINNIDGIPFEEILGYEPDLIFAPYSGFEPSEYERLSAIAPTIPFEKDKWTGTWQRVVELAGLAVGKSAEAEKVIADTKARLASYKDEYPVIEGKSFVFSGGGSDGNTVGLYILADPRIGLLSDLGLVPASALADLPTDDFSQGVSLERLSEFDADVFVGWFNDQDNVDTLLANPVFARWQPIADGHFVPLVDRAAVMALSAPSPLSIPWMMDRFVPELAAVFE